MLKSVAALGEVTHPRVCTCYKLYVPCSSAAALSDPSETLRIPQLHPEHPEVSSGSGCPNAQGVQRLFNQINCMAGVLICLEWCPLLHKLHLVE